MPIPQVVVGELAELDGACDPSREAHQQALHARLVERGGSSDWVVIVQQARRWLISCGDAASMLRTGLLGGGDDAVDGLTNAVAHVRRVRSADVEPGKDRLDRDDGGEL